MAKLPTASQINRPDLQPGAPRSGIVSYTPSGGQGLQIAGKVLGDYAAQQQEQQDKLEVAYATADSLQRRIADEQAATADDNYQAYGQRFQDAQKISNQETAKMIRNPRVRALYEANSAVDTAQSLPRIQAHAEAKHKDVALGNFTEITGNLGEKWIATKDPVIRKQIETTYSYLADSNKHLLGTANMVKAQKDFVEDNAKIAFASMTDVEKLKVLNSAVTGGGGNPVSTILKNEISADGVVRVHSDGDGMAIGGINSESYPEQFAEAKDILATKGQDAAKEYLSNFYQKEIIEKNGIDKLPPDVQDVVADGVTNHWSGFQKKLLSAAKGGASRQELLDMRKEEYRRLLATGEKKYTDSGKGWNNRIAKLQESSGGDTDFDKMAPADKAAWLSRLPELRMADAKLKNDDPEKWRVMNGITREESVAMQGGDPNYAKVLMKEQAVDEVAKFKAVENTDQFIVKANRFLQEQGEYSEQAIRGLQDAGMKPELTDALLLSKRDANLYSEHIGLLVGSSKVEDLDKKLNDRGDGTAGSIREAVVAAIKNNDIYQTQQFEYNKGSAALANYIDEQTEVAVKLAKMYAWQNPTVSASKAAEFAVKPTVDEFAIGYLNGTPFKVPYLDSIDNIEGRMQAFYDKNTAAGFGLKEKTFAEFNTAVPVLNPDKSSYRFVTLRGEPIYDKANNPVMVTIDELNAIHLPTQQEKAIQYMLEDAFPPKRKKPVRGSISDGPAE